MWLYFSQQFDYTWFAYCVFRYEICRLVTQSIVKSKLTMALKKQRNVEKILQVTARTLWTVYLGVGSFARNTSSILYWLLFGNGNIFRSVFLRNLTWWTFVYDFWWSNDNREMLLEFFGLYNITKNTDSNFQTYVLSVIIRKNNSRQFSEG